MSSVMPSVAAGAQALSGGASALGTSSAGGSALVAPGNGNDSARNDGAVPSARDVQFAGMLARVLKPRDAMIADASAPATTDGDGIAAAADQNASLAMLLPTATDIASTAAAAQHAATDALRQLIERVASDSATDASERSDARQLLAATQAEAFTVARTTSDSREKTADAKIASDDKTVSVQKATRDRSDELDAAGESKRERTSDAEAVDASKRDQSNDADIADALKRDRADIVVADSAADSAAAADAARTLDANRALAAVDPSVIVRDINALQPAFRAKLERVIDRMKDEFGHDVTVNETWRSQTRQDYLVEQGRTRPGAIVTWTRSSQHSGGTAADLVIDGKWDNPAAYQRLAQIAQEEGLQTLGARDPGHVQLAGERSMADIARVAKVTDVQLSAPTGAANTSQSAAEQTARTTSPAAPARVARVADVATVAQVATVARPGSPAAVAPQETPARATSGSDTGAVRRASPERQLTAIDNASRSAAQGAARRNDNAAALKNDGTTPALTIDARTSAGGARSDSNPRSKDDGRSKSDGRADAIRGSMDQADARGASTTESRVAELRSVFNNTARSLLSPTETVGALQSGAGSRVEHVLALQDARDAQPASQMLLRLDNGEGGEDRIRVGVRGSAVGATIEVRDSATAEQLTNRIQELSSALEARGLSTDALRVRAAAITAGSSSLDTARGLAALGESGTARSGTLFAEQSSSSRPRGDGQGQRPSQDPSRNRSRREQKGDTP